MRKHGERCVRSSRFLSAIAFVIGCAGVSFTVSGSAAEIVGKKDLFDTGTIESNEVLTESPLEESQISGIVVDQTVTQIGRAFMQGFQKAWREFNGKTRSINVAVYERPTARYGSLVWIEQNFVRVYQTFLFPGRGNPDAVGAAAAQWVNQRVADLEADKILFSDPDLAKDEF